MFIQSFAIGVSVAVFIATPASAQSLLGGLGRALQSRGMKATCLALTPPDAVLKAVFGYDRDRTSFDTAPVPENTLAAELAQKSSVTLEFQGWQGHTLAGECRFGVQVTLPPDYVLLLGGKRVLTGEVASQLRRPDINDRTWTLAGDSTMLPNVFYEYLRPHLTALVDARHRHEEQAEFARRQERERQFARDNPAEHARQQRAQAEMFGRLVTTIERSQENLRQRRIACEANGGIWGRRTRNAPPGCFARRN